MIIGNGLLANAFRDVVLPSDTLIFASGVSDSKSTNTLFFQREVDLLTSTIRENADKRLVYFSSATVLDSALIGDVYVKHKIECEEIIRAACMRHLILRVTNVVGNSGNPNTVFNFFVDRITKGYPFEVWTYACRNLIDIDDVVSITAALLNTGTGNQTFLLANPVSVMVPELVSALEDRLGRKAQAAFVAKGNCAALEMKETLSFYKENGFNFSADYLSKLIDRYLDHAC
jgi:nucleoside-diphosphate-sugar epimerase